MSNDAAFAWILIGTPFAILGVLAFIGSVKLQGWAVTLGATLGLAAWIGLCWALVSHGYPLTGIAELCVGWVLIPAGYFVGLAIRGPRGLM